MHKPFTILSFFYNHVDVSILTNINSMFDCLIYMKVSSEAWQKFTTWCCVALVSKLKEATLKIASPATK